ncbi:MAG: type II secretion system F family protein [Vulcanimicrobiota bacterium]
MTERNHHQVRCRPISLVLATRNLATLFRNGVNIQLCLDVLSDQPEDPNLDFVLREVNSLIGQGHSLASALSRFPRVFSSLYLSMVSIGERSGQLAAALESLADWAEVEFEVRGRMRRALTYPALVLGVTITLTSVLFHFFVPQMLSGLAPGDHVPAVTRLLIVITNFFHNPGVWIVAVGAGGLTVSVLREYWRSPSGSRNLVRLVVSIPVFGRLFTATSMTRFALALATLLESGVDLLAGLGLACRSCGNALVEWDAQRLLKGIEDGESVSDLLACQPDIYPDLIVQMIRVGEETSAMTRMCSKASEMLSLESQHLLESLLAAVEPLVMALVAVVVGFVLIALFGSIYSQLETF